MEWRFFFVPAQYWSVESLPPPLLQRHQVHWQEDEPIRSKISLLAVAFPTRLFVHDRRVGVCEHCAYKKDAKLLSRAETDCQHWECDVCSCRSSGADLSPYDEEDLPPRCVECGDVRACPLQPLPLHDCGFTCRACSTLSPDALD